jgi:hypothetical protein
MDFGPVLFWTLQVATNNIAYKGIAIRLDNGPGGVSKVTPGCSTITIPCASPPPGQARRVARAASAHRLRGIAFDGTHQTHASIVGQRVFINPVGPGWANPRDGTFCRLRAFTAAMTNRTGPLRAIGRITEGVFLHTNKVVVAYTVGRRPRFRHCPVYENGALCAYIEYFSKSTLDLLHADCAGHQCPSTWLDQAPATIIDRAGFHVLQIAASATPINVKIRNGLAQSIFIRPADLSEFTTARPLRWNPAPSPRGGNSGPETGPFAVDELVAPSDAVESVA